MDLVVCIFIILVEENLFFALVNHYSHLLTVTVVFILQKIKAVTNYLNKLLVSKVLLFYILNQI